MKDQTKSGPKDRGGDIVVEAGYRAFNGYIFTEADARAYNAAVVAAERSPSEENLNARHRLFCTIIGHFTPPQTRQRQIGGLGL